MARDPQNRAFASTVPDDLADPPRFGQMTETTKDVLVHELRRFFDNAQQTGARRSELPTIEKYATFGDQNDPFATSVEIVRKFPDLTEALPHVAVMATTGAERRLTIGPPYLATVQDPARVVAMIPEPYALEEGDLLVFRSLPTREEYLDRISFTAGRFPTANPIEAALAVDVARVINEQACHVHASTVEVGGLTYLRVETGGPADRLTGRTPAEVEVHRSSSVNALTVTGLGRTSTLSAIGGAAPDMTLAAPAGTFSAADVGRYVHLTGTELAYFNDGRFRITDYATDGITDTLTFASKYGKTETGTTYEWFIGLRDDHFNPLRPPKNRYGMAADLSVQIDIFTEDDNTRGEVVDLVWAFLAFFLEQKFFTFHGRSVFPGATVGDEHYQVVLNPPLRNASEAEFPRPGDSVGKVHVSSFALDVTTSMYLDRDLFWPGTDTPMVVDESTTDEDVTLPIPSATALDPWD